MIEETINIIEGVKFYKNIRILEPDDYIAGMGVHRIPLSDTRDGEFMLAIKSLGLKRVDYDDSYRAYLYAQFPRPYLAIKIVLVALAVYWASIRWLYDNARIFKQIPEGQRFSWRYFTPYIWYKKIWGKGN